MKVRARLRHKLRASRRPRRVWLGIGGATLWALADAGSAALPPPPPGMPTQAAVEAARSDLQARVEAVRARLFGADTAPAGAAPTFLAQATNWTNWPKWSNWANWANR